MDILSAAQAVQTKVAGLSGIAIAPSNPQEATVQYPYGVSFITHLEFSGVAAGIAKWLVTITTEIHVARQQINLDVQKAYPYGDSFPTAIANDPGLSGAVTATVFPIVADFVKFTETQDIGWRFETTVKLEYGI